MAMSMSITITVSISIAITLTMCIIDYAIDSPGQYSLRNRSNCKDDSWTSRMKCTWR